jgi:D-alanyl-D-alanine dipeptidase
LKYFSKDNFTGDIVPHYKANRGIMTKEAAIALSKAQKKFLEKGYSIVIYDAYRPSSSVQYFVEWMNDKNNIKRKKFNYPYIEKKIDMKDIYINSVSGHSRGSTIDLSIIDKNKILLKESIYEERTFNGKIYPFNNDNTIDCGTSFDLMDPASWSFNNKYDFTEEQKNNRKFIRDIMESEGFKVLDEEWWHFTLKNEPYPDQYFDFEIQ